MTYSEALGSLFNDEDLTKLTHKVVQSLAGSSQFAEAIGRMCIGSSDINTLLCLYPEPMAVSLISAMSIGMVAGMQYQLANWGPRDTKTQ